MGGGHRKTQGSFGERLRHQWWRLGAKNLHSAAAAL
jgi:hypothetical protein